VLLFRQTDRILIARPRLHSMQRDQNDCMNEMRNKSYLKYIE